MMQEATNNFCAIVDKTVKLLQSACPKMDSHLCDSSDFAYWQWSSSYFTMLPALGLNKESVAQIDDTILGYPEISYFKTAFLKKMKGTKYEGVFDNVSYGSPKSNINYGHLFYLPPRDFVGDIPESSLFNLDTIRSVFETIETLVDVFEDPNQEVDFSTLASFTQKLQLSDDKQTYLLFVWLKNMLHTTAMRKSEGGTYLTTNMMGLAQESLQGTLGWMSRDFPAYFYGNLMALSNTDTCEKNIKNYIREIEDDQVPKFCNNTKLNLVSAESYSFYASIYLTRDYEKIQYIYDNTGLSEQAMQGLLTPGYYLERNLMTAMKKVKKLYANTYCWRSVGLYCSNRELAYAQWIENAISLNPPKPLNESANLVELTGAHHFKPELRTFFDFQKVQMPNITVNETWDLISSGAMFNQKFIGDILLEQTSSGQLQVFNSPTFKKYLKMLMIEQGMGGLFIEKTVKEYIEGYNDKVLTSAKMQTLEEGGDPTINPWMSINDSPTNPVNSSDCFFVGDDKHTFTRSYGFWMNNRFVRMSGVNIKGLRSWENQLFNPWRENIPIRGTDGGQFNPLMSRSDEIWMFVSDIMMPLKFNYVRDVSVSGMNGWRYEADRTLLMDSTEHPDNGRFFSGVHGTLNLTSVMGAPVYATKGRYFDIGKSEDYKSIIVDRNGKNVVANAETDDVFMIVEPWSGMSLSAAQRLTLNFMLDKDYLFENTERSYLLPYTYVKREFTLNESQVAATMGDLQTALAVKKGVQIAGYLLGALLLIGGILLTIWSWKLRKTNSLSDYQVVEDYKPNGDISKKQPMLNNTSYMTNEETKEDNSAY